MKIFLIFQRCGCRIEQDRVSCPSRVFYRSFCETFDKGLLDQVQKIRNAALYGRRGQP